MINEKIRTHSNKLFENENMELEVKIGNKLNELIENESMKLDKKLEEILKLSEEEIISHKDTAKIIRLFLEKAGYCKKICITTQILKQQYK